MSENTEPKTLFVGRHISVWARGKWEFVTRNRRRPAVGIVAVTDDDRVVLVEQFRPPAEERVIELPAGLTGDVADAEDESLVTAAKRELFEETGYEAARWTELTCGYSSPGLTDEQTALFLAEGLVKRGEGGGVDDEGIVIHEVPINGILPWLAARGAKADLKLLAGLYAVQELRKDLAGGRR
jgi:ADP-ribose pyrophosphatase